MDDSQSGKKITDCNGVLLLPEETQPGENFVAGIVKKGSDGDHWQTTE